MKQSVKHALSGIRDTITTLLIICDVFLLLQLLAQSLVAQ